MTALATLPEIGGDNFEEIARILHEGDATLRHQSLVVEWLQNGCRILFHLFELSREKPSLASREKLQTMKGARKKEFDFVATISSMLNIDEMCADEVISCYWRRQLPRGTSSPPPSMFSFSTLQDVYSFYFSLVNTTWYILQQLLRIDVKSEHPFHELASCTLSNMMSRGMLQLLLDKIAELQDLQFPAPRKSHFESLLIPDNAGENTVLGGDLFAAVEVERRRIFNTFTGKVSVDWASFACRSYKYALETLVLLTYSRAHLSITQLFRLVCNAPCARDGYSCPREALAAGTPLLTSTSNLAESTPSFFETMSARLRFLYVLIFAESMQFWRALDGVPSESHRGAHPLLAEYDHDAMVQLTKQLASWTRYPSKPTNPAALGKDHVSSGRSNSAAQMQVAGIMSLLWGMFLNACDGNTASLRSKPHLKCVIPLFPSLLPSELNLWLDAGTESNKNICRGSELIAFAEAAGALGNFVVLVRDALGSPGSGGINQLFGGKVHSNSLDSCGHNGSEDLESHAAILQEAVSMAITSVCLPIQSHAGIDEGLKNLAAMCALVELTYRGNEKLIEKFWIAWADDEERLRRGGAYFHGGVEETPGGSSVDMMHPVCLLIQTLLDQTPHEPIYLLSVLRALCGSKTSAMKALQLLDARTAPVRWHDVSDLVFYCGDSPLSQGGAIEWVSFDLWKKMQVSTAFVGTRVLYCGAVGLKTAGVLREATRPPEDCYGVVIDNATNGSSELLVRWSCEVSWWDVILDIINQAPVTVSSFLSASLCGKEEEVERSSSLAALQKLKCSLHLLAALSSNQRLITVHFMQRKWERVMLSTYLHRIGAVHLFDDLLRCGFTVTTALEDKVAAMEVLTRDVQLSDEQAQVFLVALCEFARKSTIGSMQSAASGCLIKSLQTVCPEIIIRSAVTTATSAASAILSVSSAAAFPTSRMTCTTNEVSIAALKATLVSALSLLTSLVSAPHPWPSVLIDVLAEAVGPDASVSTNEFVGIMFRLLSQYEVALGKSDVAEEICRLFASVLDSCLEPSPFVQTDLQQLFTRWDDNGNGSISPNELRDGLRAMGYTVSNAAIDALFKRLDTDGSSTIDYSELIRFTTMNSPNSMSSVKASSSSRWDASLSTEVESAEKDLHTLLSNLTIPGGLSRIATLTTLANSIVEFSMSMFMELEKLPLQDRLLHWHQRVYTHCLLVLQKTLTHSSSASAMTNPTYGVTTQSPEHRQTSVAEVVCSQLARRLSQTPLLLTGLLQAATMIGLSAVQCSPAPKIVTARPFLSISVRGTDRASHGEISTQQNFPAGSVLPLDFSQGMAKYRSPSEIQGAVDVMCIAFDVLNQLLGVQAQLPSEALSSTLELITARAIVPPIVHVCAKAVHEESSSTVASDVLPLSTLLPCSYLTIICGLISSSPSKTSFVPPKRLRLRAIDFLTNVVQCIALFTSRTSTNVAGNNPLALSALIELANLSGLCQSLHDALEPTFATAFSGASTSASASVSLEVPAFSIIRDGGMEAAEAVLNLLLLLVSKEPTTLSLLFAVRGCDASTSSLSASTSVKSDDKTEGGTVQHALQLMTPLSSLTMQSAKDSLLVGTLNRALSSAEMLYKTAPIVLHKLYELLAMMWRAHGHVSLRNASLHLLNANPHYWDHVLLPLTMDLPDPPSGSDTCGLLRDPDAVSEDEEGIPTLNYHDLLAAELGTKEDNTGNAARDAFAKEARDIKDVSTKVAHHCAMILAHSSSLQLLALERHGLLFSLDLPTAMQADKKIRSFLLKATESNRFLSWLRHYMRVDSDDRLHSIIELEARECGVNLGSFIAPSSHLHPSSLSSNTRMQFGSQYIYDALSLRSYVISAAERTCVVIGPGGLNLEDDKDILDTIARGNITLAKLVGQTKTWRRFERHVISFNFRWSLLDSQMALLRSWRKFLEVYVLPGSSARMTAFRFAAVTAVTVGDVSSSSSSPDVTTSRKDSETGDATASEISSEDSQDYVALVGYSPPSTPPPGTMSPYQECGTNSPALGKMSSFSGDKRSYELVTEIARHLARSVVGEDLPKIASLSTAWQALASTQTNMGASSGREISLSDASVIAEKSALLVSMLHHQLREITFRAADPRQARVEVRGLGITRLDQTKLEWLLVLISRCYGSVMTSLALPTFPSQEVDSLYSRSQRVRREIQEQLLTGMLLVFRGIAHLTLRSRSAPDQSLTSMPGSAYSISATVRLKIFRFALDALREDISDDAAFFCALKKVTPASPTLPSMVYGASHVGDETVVLICLRLLQCALPTDFRELSLADTEAWRVETRNLRLSSTLLGLLRRLTMVTKREECNTLPEHNYSSWPISAATGAEGDILAPTRVAHITQSTAGSAANAQQEEYQGSSSRANVAVDALICLLDVFHKGIQSGILLVEEESVVDITAGIVNDLGSISLLQKYQSTLQAQAPGRCATLMGYCTVSGEISPVSLCWQRVVELVTLVVAALGRGSFHASEKSGESTIRDKFPGSARSTGSGSWGDASYAHPRSGSNVSSNSIFGERSRSLSSPSPGLSTPHSSRHDGPSAMTGDTRMHAPYERSGADDLKLSERIYSSVLEFMRTFWYLLLLPLHSAQPQARLSLRQLQLARASACFLSETTKMFRVWRAALPAMFSTTLKEMLKCITNYSTLLTDLRPAGIVALGSITANAAEEYLEEDKEEDESKDQTPEINLDRLLLSHVIAISPAEKEGRYLRKKRKSPGHSNEPRVHITMSPRKMATLELRPKGILKKHLRTASPKASGGSAHALRRPRKHVHFRTTGDDADEDANEDEKEHTDKIRAAQKDIQDSEGYQYKKVGLPAEFLVSMERAMIAALVPILTFLNDVTPSPIEYDPRTVGSVPVSEFREPPLFAVGSKVYYFSRKFQELHHAVQLMEGVVVSAQPSPHRSSTLSFEVVVSTGGHELDVEAADLLYCTPPLVAYRPLKSVAICGSVSSYSVGGSSVASSPTASVSSKGEEEMKSGFRVLAGAFGDNSFGLRTPSSPATATTRETTDRQLRTGFGLGASVWTGVGSYAASGCVAAEALCSTAHLLRLLSFATSAITSKRFAPSAEQQRPSETRTEALSPIGSTVPPLDLPAPAGKPFAGSSLVSSTQSVDRDLEVIAGFTSLLALMNFRHHARVFAHERAAPVVAHMGGRVEMIAQLLMLQTAVEGDLYGENRLIAPHWLRSEEWEEYVRCFRLSVDEVIVILTPPPEPTEEEEVELPFDTRQKHIIGLRSKLTYVQNPEDNM